jgi:hypothetical protein
MVKAVRPLPPLHIDWRPMNRLAGCRSVQDFVTVQSEIARCRLGHAVESNGRIAEVSINPSCRRSPHHSISGKSKRERSPRRLFRSEWLLRPPHLPVRREIATELAARGFSADGKPYAATSIKRMVEA